MVMSIALSVEIISEQPVRSSVTGTFSVLSCVLSVVSRFVYVVTFAWIGLLNIPILKFLYQSRT